MTESEEAPWRICVEEIGNHVSVALACQEKEGYTRWRFLIERDEGSVEFPIESPRRVLELRNYLVDTYGLINVRAKKETVLGQKPEGVLSCSGLPSLLFEGENGVRLELSKCPEYGDRYFLDLRSGPLEYHSVFIRAAAIELVTVMRKISKGIEEKYNATFSEDD